LRALLGQAYSSSEVQDEEGTNRAVKKNEKILFFFGYSIDDINISIRIVDC
jgi:hypothetical protein